MTNKVSNCYLKKTTFFFLFKNGCLFSSACLITLQGWSHMGPSDFFLFYVNCILFFFPKISIFPFWNSHSFCSFSHILTIFFFQMVEKCVFLTILNVPFQIFYTIKCYLVIVKCHLAIKKNIILDLFYLTNTLF